MAFGKWVSGTLHSTRSSAIRILRNWFLTGVVVAAPISITIWLATGFIRLVDDTVRPLIPKAWNPETYIDFALPGLGIVAAIVALTLLGALTANLIGKSLIGFGENVVERVPFVRFIYRTTKQVFETFTSGDSMSFKEAVLIEYPRKDVWAIAFITNSNPGPEIEKLAPGLVAVFVPTTPNPATGYLAYVQQDQIRRLDISVEQAAKLVFSAGILKAGETPPIPA